MNTGVPPAAVPVKPRAYKRFVTSAFHTRFVHAALLALCICWDLAFLLAPRYDFFWSWFPLGPAGLRALLYFFATVFVFILQVATVSVGKPTPTSPVQRFRQSVFNTSTLKTGVWYLASALWFTDVYMWSSSNMSWVIRGDAATQDKLDERPIYFRAFFLLLALAQTIKHVYFGLSTLQLPITGAPNLQDDIQRTHPLPDTFSFFKSQARNIVLRSVTASIAVTTICPFVYGIFLRHSLWKVHLAVAKLFFNIARSSAKPSGIPPVLGTFTTTVWVGFCLNMTWELSALLLLAFFKKPPVKEGKPWTSAGKDPNGSLLNGLKARRGIIKTFSFWELAIIAQHHPERRKVIFADIDRASGPIWSDMLAEALKVVRGVDDRIQPSMPSDSTRLPPFPTLPNFLKCSSESATSPDDCNILTGRAAKDARARQRLLEIADEKLKRLGSHPDPFPTFDVPDTSTWVSKAKNMFRWFFSSSAAAKINATVLGTPYSDAATIVDAIEVITRMLISSLQDDAYGKAMAGVPDAVKQFTKTIGLIEDVLQQNPAAGALTDVEIVHGRLRAGLAELLAAFQMFLSDSGLGISDLNAAKKASGQFEAEDEEKKRLLEAPSQRREPLDFQDAPPREEAPAESWREWSKPKKTTKLFPQYEANPRPRRQVSGGRKGKISANGTVRPREMEQVR